MVKPFGLTVPKPVAFGGPNPVTYSVVTSGATGFGLTVKVEESEFDPPGPVQVIVKVCEGADGVTTSPVLLLGGNVEPVQLPVQLVALVEVQVSVTVSPTVISLLSGFKSTVGAGTVMSKNLHSGELVSLVGSIST
jgi:hypothetical protein